MQKPPFNLNSFALALFSFFICLFYQSCSKKDSMNPLMKSDQSVQKFLQVPEGIPQIFKRVVETISKDEQQYHFLKKISDAHGTPSWQNADLHTTDGIAGYDSQDTLLVIPLVQDSANSVKSLLLCWVKKGEMSFSLLQSRSYADFGFSKGLQSFNASFVTLQFMYFNRKLFGDSLFLVTDARLFNDGKYNDNKPRFFRYKQSKKESFNQRTVVYQDQVCQGTVYDGDKGQLIGVDPGGANNYSYNEQSCEWITTIIEFTDPVNGTGLFGGFPIPGGGGGSAGGGGSGLPNTPGFPPSWYDLPGSPVYLNPEDENPPAFIRYSDLYDANAPFDKLDFPIGYTFDLILDLGVEVSDVIEEGLPPVNKKIARTTDRGNKEDMSYGYNASTDGIQYPYPTQTDEWLFGQMRKLINICTVLDGELQSVGVQMIDRFKQRSGGYFSSSILNTKVSHSATMINFLSQFGFLLKERLANAGGDINQVPIIELGPTRPIFNGLDNKFYGLQILINDTEYTEIELESFVRTNSGECTAIVSVTMIDHFGLDKHDALLYQDAHGGFATWWLLQHTRGYVPFITRVKIKKQIKWQE